MNKLNLIVVVLLILFSVSYAQFGLGASAGMLYPGLGKSDVSKSRFDPGWGYEFFIRHNVVQIGDSFMIKARWSYRYYKTTTELPNVLEIWFKFNYLTLDFFTNITSSESMTLYTGCGASLVSVSAEKDFTEVTESIFLP